MVFPKEGFVVVLGKIQKSFVTGRKGRVEIIKQGLLNVN
jgi:hypothetical protein